MTDKSSCRIHRTQCRQTPALSLKIIKYLKTLLMAELYTKQGTLLATVQSQVKRMVLKMCMKIEVCHKGPCILAGSGSVIGQPSQVAMCRGELLGPWQAPLLPWCPWKLVPSAFDDLNYLSPSSMRAACSVYEILFRGGQVLMDLIKHLFSFELKVTWVYYTGLSFSESSL